MKQILLIHGGESFSSYESYVEYLKNEDINYELLKPYKKWSTWIAEQMPEADVLAPSFPNANNAVYEEWKIYFEKIIPFFEDDVQLVGHSLGAMFLAKYLNANPLINPVKRLILVSGGYDDDSYEDLGSFKVDSAKMLATSAQEIHLFHSKDDTVVPFTELAKFEADLPSAVPHIYEDRWHFVGPIFPELLEVLQQK